MLESERIYRKYADQHRCSECQYEPNVTVEYDHQFRETVDNILKHKKSVRRRLMFLADKIRERAEKHDDSKLEYPELGWLVNMDKEGHVPYGSDEYFEKQERWKCFFDHHYANNTHHPDHNGIEGVRDMTIVDLIEMMCDMISYLDEFPQEKAFEVVNEQAKRFGLSEELERILIKTLMEYFVKISDIEPDYNPKDYICTR